VCAPQFAFSDDDACWRRPLPPSHEVGDRANTVDEYDRRPQPLAAIDRVGWTPADVDQRRDEERKLEHAQEHDASFLRVRKILPLFLSHQQLLSHAAWTWGSATRYVVSANTSASVVAGLTQENPPHAAARLL
jgi:hypothetical protein